MNSGTLTVTTANASNSCAGGAGGSAFGGNQGGNGKGGDIYLAAGSLSLSGGGLNGTVTAGEAASVGTLGAGGSVALGGEAGGAGRGGNGHIKGIGGKASDTGRDGSVGSAGATSGPGSDDTGSDSTIFGSVTTIPPSPPPASPPPAPPSHPPATRPTLRVPPLLAFFDSLLGATEKFNADGTETITDSLFGIPLLVSTFDASGKLESVALLGINVTALFELL